MRAWFWTFVKSALVAFVTFSAPLSASTDAMFQDGITGVEATALIKEAMRQAEIIAQTQVSPYRSYPACSRAPEIRTKDAAWAQVDMICADPHAPWTRTLRTNAKLMIPQERSEDPQKGKKVAKNAIKVLILAENLKRGTIIEGHHLTTTLLPREGLGGYFQAKEDVIGRRMAQHLNKGQMLMIRHLQMDWTVEKDQPVAITFIDGGFTVQTQGTALENGQLGEMIELRNNHTGRLLKGIVSGPHKITVRPKINLD